MKLKLVSAALSAALIFICNSALATKPCFAPCITNNAFNRDECTKLASWIAIATISNVVHDPQGYPLNKDFASFTINIQTWEKGEVKTINGMNFKVGWCDNYQTPPADSSGKFRFYGTGVPGGKDSSAPGYLYFEAVK